MKLRGNRRPKKYIKRPILSIKKTFQSLSFNSISSSDLQALQSAVDTINSDNATQSELDAAVLLIQNSLGDKVDQSVYDSMISGNATDAEVATIQQALLDAIENQALEWNSLVMNWSSEPTLNATIATGEVYDYTLGGVTRYRFVPIPYDPTQDAFYEGFDGTTLTNLITTRG